MNVEMVIARECPRYIEKETIFHGERKKLILDTHAGFYESFPVGVFPVNEDITSTVEKMNAEYENHLRSVFK